ncbi:sulfotransferase family 2 domain-containing protein [Colwellia sp. UCD-KL20]|uniref:sulfotransferase family 2 domain-containing protein n=1 Tax=Colwellia sp. UCD-KL20 TaxID=1917165 RepID=UPI000970EC1F|nr:sulfotransferase family 2 domain-containing protein [Colwellia sp. UCD-KL20]
MTSFKHKLNLFHRYPYWAKAKCIYIHVPKAAGTSINKAVFGRTLGHYKATEIQKKFPKLFKKSFVFSVVRNPWSRIYSAYQFAKIGKTESMGINQPEKYQIPAFDSFETFLFDWLATKNIEELDFVFQPQHAFIYDEQGHLLTDFVGKVETLTSDIKVINKKLGRSITIPHANKTSTGESYKEAYLNQAMIDIVQRIYAKDIELFGYEY